MHNKSLCVSVAGVATVFASGINADIAMSSSTASSLAPTPASTAAMVGLRENGKNWHVPKKAFRPSAGQTSYAKRMARQSDADATKKVEREMRAEKEEERQRRVQAIKDKRAAKEERERYEKMAQKMHQKRVERLKRREKKNKMLKS